MFAFVFHAKANIIDYSKLNGFKNVFYNCIPFIQQHQFVHVIFMLFMYVYKNKATYKVCVKIDTVRGYAIWIGFYKPNIQL